MSVICPDFNWKDAISRINEGFKGFGVEVPSVDEFQAIVESARSVGRLAASEKLRELQGDNEEFRMLGLCGRAIIILDIDGRSAFGRFLNSIGNSIPNFSVSTLNQGYAVHIGEMHHRQEQSIDEVASQAALSVLSKRLNVYGYLEKYLD